MIRTQADLIKTLKETPTTLLYWDMGNRPSDSGSYHLTLSPNVRVTVHGNAAKAAIQAKAVKAVRSTWRDASYRLSAALRHSSAP